MKIVVANWKANGTKDLCEKFIEKSKKYLLKNEFVICPPNIFLSSFQNANINNFYLGAQDCSIKNIGAYTGETPCEILKNFNVKYAIIGHSERRELFCENNELIKEKLIKANENRITPILCVGKNIESEIEVLKNISFNVIIAYEPLWAIGTGKIETIENCIKVKNNIEKLLNKKIKFLYGGSINLDNYKTFLNSKEIDGLLVGRASLSESVLEMCK